MVVGYYHQHWDKDTLLRGNPTRHFVLLQKRNCISLTTTPLTLWSLVCISQKQRASPALYKSVLTGKHDFMETLTHSLGLKSKILTILKAICIKTCVQLSPKDLCWLNSLPHRAGKTPLKSTPWNILGGPYLLRHVRRINWDGSWNQHGNAKFCGGKEQNNLWTDF